MTQPFADALTWVPKSRALGASLGRAHDLARARSHPAVTLEHLLLALIEDPDASAVLLSCNVDLLALNKVAADFVDGQPQGAGDPPSASPALTTILEYAVAAARQSRRNEINGAIVLAAVVGEGKSDAARMLLSGGLTFADAVAVLKRSSASRPPAAEPGAEASPPAPPSHQAVAGALAAPAPPAPQAAPPAVNGHHEHDPDPVTTARRRIAAIRSGQTPPPVAPNGIHAQRGTEASAVAADHAGTGWAPPPMPVSEPTAARPPRMPPPVPPIVEPRLRAGAPTVPAAAPPSVPWSDGEAALPEDRLARGPGELPPDTLGAPIDPIALVERLPERMTARVASTVELRISRSAVLSTAAALGGQTAASREAILTRALAVRIRAPAGGFHIENASAETQWFDTRSPQRDEDEVRWRWLVTPHARGRKPLQLTLVMRTVAADGLIVETMLPEAQTTVRVAGNIRASLRTWLMAAGALLAGAALTLLATGSWSALLARLLG